MDSDAIRKRAEEVADTLAADKLDDETWEMKATKIADAMMDFAREYATKMVEAVPEKPMNPEITITETGHDLYRAGWNACRAEMRKGNGNG